MAGAFSKHRFQIWNGQQHPYKHKVEEFSYTNEVMPGVVNLGEAIDYLVSVLYPVSQGSVATKADLPITATFVNTPGATTTIVTTGDEYKHGDRVYFESTGTLPTGLSPATVYYLFETAPNTFELFTDKGNNYPAATSDVGVGVHSIVNIPASYRVVLDDGDGKAASYRWQQLEGDVAFSWQKVGDLDWGLDTVLAEFQNITQGLYVYKNGKDDRDENGNVLAGDSAGQHVFGGASANTNLILHANSGDGTGPQTGNIFVTDEFAPFTDATLSLGSIAKKFKDLFLSGVITVDTMTISTGSITDSTGAISFGDEDLSTTGDIAATDVNATRVILGNMTMQSDSITSTSPAISFGTNNIETGGDVKAETVVVDDGTNTTTITNGLTDTLLTSSLGSFSFQNADVKDIDSLTTTSFNTGVITVDDLTLDTNTISSVSNVEITPAALSTVELNADTNVAGAMTATGAVTGASVTDGKHTLDGSEITSVDGYVDIDATKIVRAGDIEVDGITATTLTSPLAVTQNIEDINAFPFATTADGEIVQKQSGVWVPTDTPFFQDVQIVGPGLGNRFIGHHLALVSSTGLLKGGVISVGTPNNTISISDGSGEVVDLTDINNPVVTPVSWTGLLNIPITNIALQDVTYILISKLGAVIQQATYPTPTERRQAIFLGRVNHSDNTTVSFADTFPDCKLNHVSSFYDLMDAIAPFKIEGLVVTPNGANLSINRAEGKAFFRSANYATNINDPHEVPFLAATPQSFRKMTRNDIVDAVSVNVIDPANYDNAGVVTAVGGSANSATVQRVYLYKSGLVSVQYGQHVYTKLADAIAAIPTETFEVNPTVKNNAILIAHIAVVKTATSLQDPTTSYIAPTGRFDVAGVGGGGASDLQGAYLNSTQPQLALNSTQGGLEIRDASTPLGTNLLAVRNSAGTATYLGIGANGLSTTNFTGTGTTGAVRVHNLTTTQKNALTPAAGMIVYDTTLNQMQGYANGEWGELTRELQTANTSLAAGAELAISLTHSRQTWLVAGASAPVTLSATPFGSAEPVYGAEITLIGNSDANPVTIPVNDASFGVIGYSVTLGKGQVATYKYNGTLLRYVIKSVSN